MCKPQKGIDIFGGYHNRHALLAFADCKLGSVQPLILFRNRVEVDQKPVGKLPDGNRDSAGTEIVALLDFAAGIRIAEQPLKLPLLRRVSFLHLGTAGFQ